MTTSLHNHFRWIPDPRTGNNKKHNLLEVIILSVLAVLCGAESWYEMEEFGKEKEDFLKQLLPLENGIPSHDTINRVFMMIDAGVFERCFRAWTAELGRGLETAAPSTEKELIAIDGKSICNSACKHQGLGALHLVIVCSFSQSMFNKTAFTYIKTHFSFLKYKLTSISAVSIMQEYLSNFTKYRYKYVTSQIRRNKKHPLAIDLQVSN